MFSLIVDYLRGVWIQELENFLPHENKINHFVHFFANTFTAENQESSEQSRGGIFSNEWLLILNVQSIEQIWIRIMFPNKYPPRLDQIYFLGLLLFNSWIM